MKYPLQNLSCFQRNHKHIHLDCLFSIYFICMCNKILANTKRHKTKRNLVMQISHQLSLLWRNKIVEVLVRKQTISLFIIREMKIGAEMFGDLNRSREREWSMKERKDFQRFFKFNPRREKKRVGFLCVGLEG